MQLFQNNYTDALGAALPESGAAIALACGGMIEVSGNDFMLLTLEGGGKVEIVKVTAHAQGSLECSIERAQEGTTAQAWRAGDKCEARLTAGAMADAMAGRHIDTSAMIGPKGEQGPPGERGEGGAEGPPGSHGQDGSNGADGQDGVDGVSPHIGGNGNWFVGELDTGTRAQGPQGEPGRGGEKGQDGEDGRGVNILGSFSNESELPGSGVPGDAYLITGDLWVWSANNACFVNAGSIQGPPGSHGQDGSNGADGQDGADGVSPHIGGNGNWFLGELDTGTRAQGPQGAQGEQGPPGEAGSGGGAIWTWRPTSWMDVIMSNISKIPGAQVGDSIVFVPKFYEMHGEILGVHVCLGDIVRATSESTGIKAGNLPIGANDLTPIVVAGFTDIWGIWVDEWGSNGPPWFFATVRSDGSAEYHPLEGLGLW